MITLIYNTLMFMADALLVRTAAKRPSFKVAIVALAAFGVVGLALAIMLGEHLFGTIRLLCYATFLHGVILLLGLGAALLKASRKGTVLCAIFAALLAMIAADAFLIEPHWLEVSHITLRSTKIRRSVRVAVIADFQT